MSDNSPSGGTALLQRKMSSRVMQWVMSGIATAAIAIGGWAHALLWGHAQTIAVNSTEISNLKTQHITDSSRLDRMDDKLDRILEELRK